jgi:hypothetical protein
MTPSLAALVLSGTLSDGSTWELHPTTHAVEDAMPVGDKVWFITSGGGLGRVQADTGTLLDLSFPDPHYTRFVDSDDDEIWVVDANQRIHRLDDDLEPGPVVARYPEEVVAAWKRDGRFLAVVHKRERHVPLLVRRLVPFVHYRFGRPTWFVDRDAWTQLPRSTNWFLADDDLWWARDYGEFGSAIGTKSGDEIYTLSNGGFALVQGEVLAFGGSGHMYSSATISDLDGLRFESPYDDAYIGPNQRIVYLTEGEGGNHVAVTEDGGRFQSTDLTDWTRLSQVTPITRISRSLLRAGRPGGSADWLWSRELGLFRVGAESTHAAAQGAPRAVDLRWREDELCVVGANAGVYCLQDGAWNAQLPPAPPDDTHLTDVTLSAEGPTWWWWDHEGSRSVGRGQPGERTAPEGSPVQLPSGEVLWVSLYDTPGATNIKHRFRLDDDVRWAAGHQQPTFGSDDHWFRYGEHGLHELPAPVESTVSLTLPLQQGGWFIYDYPRLYLDVDGTRVSMGRRGRHDRIHDVRQAEGGDIWVVGTRVQRVHGRRLITEAGFPKLGTCHRVQPLEGRRVALACDAGVLLIDRAQTEPPRHPWQQEGEP